MPEVATHLPSLSTAAPNAQKSNGANGARNAGAKDGARADEAKGGEDGRAFASVLQGKCADAQGKDEAAAKEGEDGSTTAAADPAAQAAQPPLPTEPQPMSIDALIAQRLAATRPDGAAKGEDGLPGKTGKDVLGLTGDPRATLGVDRDARRPAAGVTGPAAGVDAKDLLAASKEEASSGGVDFTALLGRLRQEGSGKNAAATQAADTPTSTLSMLMPANQIADTAPAAATRPTTLIEAPVGSPMFADEAAQRVTWLAKNGIEHAEIRVTPPDMGPIQVSIDMSQNEASINFTVTQTDTRVALEDSLHRLEEMLADSGIALAQANIGQRDASSQSGQSGQSGQQSGRPGQGDGGGRGNNGLDAIGGPALQAASRPAGGLRGLVDTFA